jgi:polysaccharide biosynthesis/export protein
MPQHSTRTGPFQTIMGLVGIIIILTAGSGCLARRTYSPANLPAEYDAMPVYSAHSLDLTRLAGPPVGNERIHPGDVLDISIAGGLGSDAVTKFPLRVNDDGSLSLPEIGLVHVAGLELSGAEQAIAAASVARQQYVHPAVNLSMNHRAANRVTVVGAVEKQGVVELPRASSSLLDAIVAAGGLAEDAGTNVEIRQPVTIRRPINNGPPLPGQSPVQQASATMETITSVQSIRVDLVEAVTRVDSGLHLEDGSVVMVEKKELHPVEVIGLVREPGQYEFPVNKDLSLLGAVALAGGVRNPLADKVLVRRFRPGMDSPVVIIVSINDAKHRTADNLRLEPGDVVSVEKTPATVALDAVNLVRFSLGSSVPLF